MQREKRGVAPHIIEIYMAIFLVLFILPISVYADEAKTLPAAVIWYQELASQGDIDAKYNLGMIYETGWGVTVDLKKAIRWYRDAAKQGHDEAQFRLGMLYYLGMGARQSDLKGESWIRKSSAQGHVFAKILNEKLFGEDVPETLDPKKVLEQVRSVYLHNESRANETLNELINAARKKSHQQQKRKEETTIRERREIRTVIGPSATDASQKKPKTNEIERIGSDVPGFIAKSTLDENQILASKDIATIKEQANKGMASAQYNLGRMYELGLKVEANRTESIAWYEKSAAQGYADAEYRLAIAMYYGPSNVRNEVAAKKWLTLAAGHGHQVAKNLLASITNKEGAFNQGSSIAVSWYLERAMTGDAEAALRLGKIFEHGWGAVPNIREAGKWYKQAGTLGLKEAAAISQRLNTNPEKEIDKASGSASDKIPDKVSNNASINNSNDGLRNNESANQPTRLDVIVEKLGLPAWATHPASVFVVFAIILLPVFIHRRVSGRQ